MKIQTYSFGKLKIDGKVYESDLIISENSIQENWQRKISHVFDAEEVVEILKTKPNRVIIGTGLLGLMKVDVEAKNVMRKHNIKLHVMKTKRAIRTYKSINNKENVILAVHLTC
jgi:hypothetical protein